MLAQLDILHLTNFVDHQQLIVTGVIILISMTIYSAMGFGSGLIAVTLVGLLYGNLSTFVPMFLILCLPTEFVVTYKDRKYVDIKKVWVFLLISAPAIILGSYFLKNFPKNNIIFVILSITIMATSIYFLFFSKNTVVFKNRFWKYLFGLTSGFLGSLYSIGGPPLIVYFKGLNLEKSEFRAVLISIFFFMGLLKVVIYSLFGFYTTTTMFTIITMSPFVAVGIVLGNILHYRIPEKTFRKATSIFLLFSGALLLIKSLLQL